MIGFAIALTGTAVMLVTDFITAKTKMPEWYRGALAMLLAAAVTVYLTGAAFVHEARSLELRGYTVE
jgi:peptidoglycan/LPS O-acetylase OafA/YrhL